jgi:hypothetical protein
VKPRMCRLLRSCLIFFLASFVMCFFDINKRSYFKLFHDCRICRAKHYDKSFPKNGEIKLFPVDV